MDTNNTQATLIAHCGGRKISRDELRDIPMPEATRTHQPLSHLEVVKALEETLSYRSLKIKREEFAVSSDGMKMFGVMDLTHGFEGCTYSVGLRNSNDKSMRLALTAGYRVFVCDNMAFSGEFTPLLYKHSQNLNLLDTLSIAVDRIHRNFEPMKEKVKKWQETIINDELAKLVIYEAFLDKKLKAPRFLLPVVHDSYFTPVHEDFARRSLWSLSNAFTSAFKRLKPVQQFAATAKLGGFLEPVANRIEEAKVLPFATLGSSSGHQAIDDPEIADLVKDYDSEAFADEMKDDSESIEDELYDEYEDEDFGDEDEDIQEAFLRNAA